jgi:hypothetical protein
VANVSDVTVLAAGPVVAIVKITSAHTLYPFVVVVEWALDIVRQSTLLDLDAGCLTTDPGKPDEGRRRLVLQRVRGETDSDMSARGPGGRA